MIPNLAEPVATWLDHRDGRHVLFDDCGRLHDFFLLSDILTRSTVSPRSEVDSANDSTFLFWSLQAGSC